MKLTESELRSIVREEINEAISTKDPSQYEPDPNSRKTVEKVLGLIGFQTTRYIDQMAKTPETGEWIISFSGEQAVFANPKNIAEIDSMVDQFELQIGMGGGQGPISFFE